MSAKLVQCYNTGCLKKFDPSTNTAESCVHHPGKPVFHDAYKYWSCCQKKTTDFTDFLNTKGCTTSYHRDQKPPEPPKPEKKAEEKSVPPSEPLPLPKRPTKRPDRDEPMERLSSSVGASLAPLLGKLSLSKKEEAPADNGDGTSIVSVGTSCKNAGCKQTYRGESSNGETCLYHSGVPIFHEGMKYWTCCQRKTSDFNSFLDQEGCTTGNHTWFKKESREERAECRYDWHQTGSHVVVSVFSKVPIPEHSYVEANRVKLHVHVTFGEHRSVFDETLFLTGVIDVQKSSVQFLGTKVEIKLKKAEPEAWRFLLLPEEKPKPATADEDGDVNLDADA